MKLTNTLTMKRKAGMTLLELTVVILVLLSLISILFIGARAWKKGSDRAANILNIRNVQQAVRAHCRMFAACSRCRPRSTARSSEPARISIANGHRADWTSPTVTWPSFLTSARCI